MRSELQTFDPHELLAWILIAGDIDVEEGRVLAEKARTIPVHWSRSVSMVGTPWRPSFAHALRGLVPDLRHGAGLPAGVSREMIRKVLRTRRDEGSIVSNGVGRGASWRRLAGKE